MREAFAQYQGYQVADFMSDPHFRQWVLVPDASNESFWQAFQAEQPDRESTLLEARYLLCALQEKYNPVLVDEVTIQQDFAQLTRRIQQPPQRQFGTQRWAIAAAVLLLIGAGLYFLWPDRAVAPIYSTAYGEQLPVTLPDGSTVMLNAHSQLQQLRFDDTHRVVRLQGEAYFSVAHQPEAPFQVITSDLVLEVLGTTFNVNSNRHQTAVYLEEGSVKVELEENQENTIFLEPGDVLAYSIESRKILDHRKSPATEWHTSWKDGVLKFKDTPLQLVLKRLEDIYGIKCQIVSDELSKRTLNSTGVPIDQLDLALTIVGKAMQIDFVENEGVYSVIPKTSN